MAESIARDIGPLGVHVAYVLIDAVIDTPPNAQSDEFFIKLASIVEELFHLYGQDRSA